MRLFVDFIPVIVWALLAMVLVIVMLLASWVLRPHVLQNSEKTSTYECGEEPIGPARISYPYNYIVYTILFVVVDVMGAFLWLLAPNALFKERQCYGQYTREGRPCHRTKSGFQLGGKDDWLACTLLLQL